MAYLQANDPEPTAGGAAPYISYSFVANQAKPQYGFSLNHGATAYLYSTYAEPTAGILTPVICYSFGANHGTTAYLQASAPALTMGVAAPKQTTVLVPLINIYTIPPPPLDFKT